MKCPVIESDMKMIMDTDLPWDTLAGKCILISGANGFLPAYMVETLLYLNEKRNFNIKIIGLVRNKENAAKRFSKYQNRNDILLIEQDVSNHFTISEKVDFIIHAASQASPKYYGIDPVGTLSANVFGTRHLLEIARTHNTESFLFFSSGEVYGEVSELNVPTKEHMYGDVDPLKVRSCYAEGKRMGENMCISYAHQYGLAAKIIRPFHIYGPGLKLDDGRVFSDFVADILHRRNLAIHGDGKAIRAFCYLSDAVLGFFTILLKGKNSEAYNIGNPYCALTIEELATRLVTLFSDRNLQIIRQNRQAHPGYIPSKISINCPDISRAKELGWDPKVSIEEGFSKTVESFHEYN